jgi:heptosyltransferase-2
MNQRNRRSVLIQTSFIGDCVLTLPLVDKILEVDTEMALDIVTTPQGGEVFKLALSRGLNQYVNRLRILEWNKNESKEKTPWAMYRWVRQNFYEHGIKIENVYCVQRSFRTGLLALMLKARNRVGFSSGASSFLYTHLVQRDWNSGKSEIEKNLDLVRALRSDVSIPSWVFDKKSPSHLGLRLPERGSFLDRKNNRILMGLGSPWPTKDWPLENVKSFIEKAIEHNFEVVLTGGKQALTLSQEIEKEFRNPLLLNHCGRTNFQSWVDLVDTATVVVSGDSATVHVASDLGVPVLALFGPTVPDFGFAPWRRPSLVLGVKDLECRPCDIHGPKVCPLGHHKCMKEISPQKVFNFALDFLLSRNKGVEQGS